MISGFTDSLVSGVCNTIPFRVCDELTGNDVVKKYWDTQVKIAEINSVLPEACSDLTAKIKENHQFFISERVATACLDFFEGLKTNSLSLDDPNSTDVLIMSQKMCSKACVSKEGLRDIQFDTFFNPYFTLAFAGVASTLLCVKVKKNTAAVISLIWTATALTFGVYHSKF